MNEENVCPYCGVNIESVLMCCSDCFKKIQNGERLEEKYAMHTITDNGTIYAQYDAVNHPSHYTTGNIEVIDFIQDKLTPEEFEGYCKGNALKYICRAGKKDKDKKEEDMLKAVWYITRFVNSNKA